MEVCKVMLGGLWSVCGEFNVIFVDVDFVGRR